MSDKREETNDETLPNERFKGLNPMTGESAEPIQVSFEDVSAAAFRIRQGIRHTSCDVSKIHGCL